MKRNVLLLTIAVIVVCLCAFVGCIGNGNQGTTPIPTPNPGLDEGTIQKVYAAAQELGFEGTLEEFLEMCQGEDGKSAYEIAVEYGFEGTEEEWLESLKGEKGDKGAAGKDGRDGIDGEDGRDGRDGKDGKDGLDGKDGQDGAPGKDGEDGKDGENGKDGKDGEDGQDGKDGKDGRTPEFRVYEGWLQWKYTDETEWKNLYYVGEGGSGSGNPPTEGTVRITFVLNGGSMPEGVASYIDVTPETEVTLPTPTLSGYQFVGWYLKDGASAVASKYFAEENVTLYAKWRKGEQVKGTPIYSMEDLVKMRNDLTATYVLMNNIDCGGLALPVCGDSESNAFSGTFEGQGFTISNYTISYNNYMGIFGYSTGTIRNLNVMSCSIEVKTFTMGDSYVGAIAGCSTGTIEQCSVSGCKIYINVGADIYAGLVCGSNLGLVQNCCTEGSVSLTAYYYNYDSHCSVGGGIVGQNGGTVRNCFSRVVLSAVGSYGNASVIVGSNKYKKNKTVIENCVSFGSISKGDQKGDVCSFVSDYGTVKNCYRDETLSPTGLTCVYATAMSKATMSQKNFWLNYALWDEKVWNFNDLDLENGKFPTLRYNAK